MRNMQDSITPEFDQPDSAFCKRYRFTIFTNECCHGYIARDASQSMKRIAPLELLSCRNVLMEVNYSRRSEIASAYRYVAERPTDS